jgi:hypothetical protein
MKNFSSKLLFFSCLLFANSVFAQQPILTNAIISGGDFSFQVLTTSNQTFTIEVSSNLASWSVAGTETATSSIVSLTDPSGVSAVPQRFYRIMLGGESKGSSGSFNFSFLEFTSAGNFNGGSSTPDTTFPVSLNSYSALFEVDNDTNYPDATNVLFTGPSDSDLTNAPGDPSNSNISADNANYQSPIISNPAIAPGGTWVVNYKGSNETFSVTNPPSASNLVIPYPTITVSGGQLQNVSWVYLNATNGATLSGPPAYMVNLQLQVYGMSQGTLYDSTNLPPTTTSQAVSPSVAYSNVSGIGLAYQDTAGNNYIVSFGHQNMVSAVTTP